MILSNIEKKAIKVNFHRNVTVIYWANWTWKSSLIKSIYRTLGGQINLHPNFEKTEPITYLNFDLDGQSFSILRDGNNYSLFDEKDNLIWTYSSVTKELWPKLAEIFDFKLKLAPQNLPKDREESLIIPPPAFLLLPFYIDQDKSWSASWSSFQQLKQFKNFRKSLIDYQLGIHTNEFYDLNEELTLLRWKKTLIQSERDYAHKISDDIQEKLSSIDFNIDINEFEDDISLLLNKCDSLRKKEELMKWKLRELFDLKYHTERQITIVEEAILESKRDYEFANQIQDFISCPTCGAWYENSFAERFWIAMDENRESDLLIELKKELAWVNKEILKEKNLSNLVNEEISDIETILAKKKNHVILEDILKNYWKNQAKSVFSEKLNELDSNIGSMLSQEKELLEKIKKTKDKNRTDKIKNDYLHTISSFLQELWVTSMNSDFYGNHYSAIEEKESWSAKPRALIAYYFTFFHLMKKYGTSTYFPLVIDSPNQQAQDPPNIKKILDFIKLNYPSDSQMILWLEEMYSMDFWWSVVNCNSKWSLLREEEFREVSNHLTPYLKKMWL